MKLTKEQIAEIKSFIGKRGIAYLDVKMEVLDHVAAAVEEKMTENQNLSFDIALKQTHASFGIFGFSVIEGATIDALTKKYRKIFWRNFLRCFNLKHIVIVLLGGLLLYRLQVLINDTDFFMTILFIAIIALISMLAVIVLNLKGFKNFLVYRSSAVYLMFMGSFLQIFNYAIKGTPKILIWGVNSSFFFTTLLLIFFISYVVSAIRTALVGIKESELLMQKYQLIEN